MTPQMRAGVRVGAVVAPIVVAVVASLIRDVLANPGAALLLVLVVVAVGAFGDRPAGVLAALVSAAAFDFFLTAPYRSFAILDRTDVEIAVLLLAIGLAVTEIAQWGRRQQADAGRRHGYLVGVARAAQLAADGRSGPELIETTERMIADVLELDACRYAEGPPVADRPVLARDGTVHWGGRTVDLRREGLPGMDVIELPAGDGGSFLLTASSWVRRPDREQLVVAVTLAEQVGQRTRPTAP